MALRWHWNRPTVLPFDMTFWELNDDDSRGYYYPVPGKAARNNGGQLVSGLLDLIASLFRLAGSLLMGIATLLFILLRWIWRLIK